MTLDKRIRIAAFNWLSEQVEKYGDVLEWELLKEGFQFENERIHLVSPQGIFKPRQLEVPLTIRTAANGPYKDLIAKNDFIYYKYQGEDPNDYDNLGLKRAMELGLPLIYFFWCH